MPNNTPTGVGSTDDYTIVVGATERFAVAHGGVDKFVLPASSRDVIVTGPIESTAGTVVIGSDNGDGVRLTAGTAEVELLGAAPAFLPGLAFRTVYTSATLPASAPEGAIALYSDAGLYYLCVYSGGDWRFSVAGTPYSPP
jgi:hypothetical protein